MILQVGNSFVVGGSAFASWKETIVKSPQHLPVGISLTCSECGTPVTATREFIGREISCPACLAAIAVTEGGGESIPLSLTDDLQGFAVKQPATETEDGTLDDSYRIAFFGEEKGAMPATKETVEAQAAEDGETFSLAKPGGRSAEAEDSLTYSIGSKVERPPEKIEVFKALSNVKREKRPPPPASLFFSNVFQFPWSYPAAIANWCYLAVGISFMGLLFGVCVWMLETMGRTGWLGMGFLMMGIVWVGLWSLSFAAAVGVAIVTETAAGMDRVESWGEGGWRDWLFEFAVLLWIYVFSGFVCMPMALLLKEAVGYLSPQLFVMQFFVFPALWLSAMDSESVLIPYSGLVVGSFRRIPRTWAKFYGLALAVLVPPIGIVSVAFWFNAWLGGSIAGPILASVVFIYSRLLGRLGYAVIVEMEKPEKPKAATKD